MTELMQLRRSQRSQIKSKQNTSAQSNSASRESDDNESMLEEEGEREQEYEEEGGEEEEEEDEYTPSSRKRKTASSLTNTRKKRNNNRFINVDSSMVNEDFQENELYRNLCNPEVSIHDLVLEWIDNYQEDYNDNKHDSITQLINLILRSCGCTYLFQPHDLVNLESASQTIGELVLAFRNQGSHEYPFISNNKNLKFFKHNIIDFYQELIDVCHERELLYKESMDDDESNNEESLASPLMNQFLTWILSLSVCNLRPLRYVSTSVILSVNTKLCDIISSVTGALDKQKRQLQSTKKTKRPLKQKIDAIEANITQFDHWKNTLIEYCDDITETAFIHRYHDVDSLIRQECISQLAAWMLSYPEKYLESSYLRYFGWLLSDPNNSVRNEVMKSLVKLNKYSNAHSSIMEVGLRQFTDMYKDQMINMLLVDHDYNVKTNIITIMMELHKAGCLTSDDHSKLGQNYLNIIKFGSGLSKSNDDRFKTEYSKLVYLGISSSIEKSQEYYKETIEDLDQEYHTDFSFLLSLKILLSSPSLCDEEAVSSFTMGKDCIEKFPLAVAYKYMNTFTDMGKLSKYLVRYFLFDASRIDLDQVSETNRSVAEELKDTLELNEDESVRLLELIYGTVLSMQSFKSKWADNPDYKQFRVILIDNFGAIANKQLKSTGSGSDIFLWIWDAIITVPEADDSFYSTFQTTEKLNIYTDITIKILNFYQDVPTLSDDTSKCFNSIFNKLLAGFNYNENLNIPEQQLLNTNIKIKVNDVLNFLLDDIKNTLNENLLADNPLGKVISSAASISKFVQLGNYIDICDVIEKSQFPLLETIISDILDVFNLKELEKENIDMETFSISLRLSLDIFLMVNSIQIEKLLEVKSNQSHFDMGAMFEPSYHFIKATVKLVCNCEELIRLEDEGIGSYYDENHLFEIKRRKSSIINILTMVGSKIIDILVSLKVFYYKYESNNEFSNFSRFFNGPIGHFIKQEIPIDLQKQFLNIYLIKETALAQIIGIDLERMDEENVNYGNEFIGFDDSDETNEQETDETQQEGSNESRLLTLKTNTEKQIRLWKAERDLCVFTVKLFTLINLNMVNKFVLERINLNAARIGGLYLKIVKQNEASHNGEVSQEAESSQIHSHELESEIA